MFIDGIWSERVELRAGTPQGSCLSPILYLIFVNDLTDCLDLTKSTVSQYADDVGLWATSKNATEAESIIQAEMVKLEQWCRKWHVTLHPAKSKLILFTKCPRHKEQMPNGPRIQVFNEHITAVGEADFLGVAFDSRLTWEPQTRKIIAKAYKRLNLLRAVAAQASNPKPEVLKTLYKSTILSVFEYPCVCIGTAAEAHLQKLQLVQNQAIRVILGTPRYISISDLHDCSGLLPVKEHLIWCAKRRIAAMETTSPIIGSTISDYMSVRHILENASILDAVQYRNH